MSEPLERDTLFKKLRSKPENKVRSVSSATCPVVLHYQKQQQGITTTYTYLALPFRYALIVPQRTPHGLQYRMGSLSAWLAPGFTGAWASMSALSGTSTSILLSVKRQISHPHNHVFERRSTTLDTWTEDQLRVSASNISVRAQQHP